MKKKITRVKKENICIVAGDFDPLSQEDLEKIKIAKKKGDWLIVGVHTDARVTARKGVVHFPYEFRSMIMRNMKHVDEIFTAESTSSNDDRLLIMTIKQCYPNANYLYFSDDISGNTPESQIKGITITKF